MSRQSLEPVVTSGQELIVTALMPSMQWMSAMPPKDAQIPLDIDPDGETKRLFAARLNALCDDNEVPPKGKNRQSYVGKLFGVTQKAARKWLEAEGLPTLTKCIEIANKWNVHVEWLLTGRGPKLIAPPPEAPVDDDVLDLARRIMKMPQDHRELLMSVFSSAVQDNDPRLGKWSAAHKSPSRKSGK